MQYRRSERMGGLPTLNYGLSSLSSHQLSFVRLASFVRNERHEPGSLDRLRDGVLAGGCTASLATAHNATVTVGQLAEQVEVFVIDKHRTRTDAVDADRVFFSNFDVGSFGHELVLRRFFSGGR